MKGDFSADRFDPDKNYSAVLHQQGRVELDSDWNEQVAIQQQLMRTLIVDLLGPAAGPAGNCGFAPAGPEDGVAPAEGDFAFGAGRYYVDGLPVENRVVTLYSRQPYAGVQARLTSGRTYLAYLDVWERHVTWLDDGDLRDPALGGADTCTRRQPVWAVKVLEMATAEPDRIEAELGRLRDRQSGRLAARLAGSGSGGSFGGVENRFYRIEVHESGDTEDPGHPPSFKWSRDNGSVTARLLGKGPGTPANALRVAGQHRFSGDCWVEILSEADDLHGRGGHLARLIGVGEEVLTLAKAPPESSRDAANPRVRRWDHDPRAANAKGALDIVPGHGDSGWIAIEDGIEIRFSRGAYRAGDYWQIVSRNDPRAIHWPEDPAGHPLDQPPKGIVHHYAPLFLLNATAGAPYVEIVRDCRCRLAPLPYGDR